MASTSGSGDADSREGCDVAAVNGDSKWGLRADERLIAWPETRNFDPPERRETVGVGVLPPRERLEEREGLPEEDLEGVVGLEPHEYPFIGDLPAYLGVPLEVIFEPKEGVVGVPVTREGRPLGLEEEVGPGMEEGVLKRGVLRALPSLGEAAVEVLDTCPIFSIPMNSKFNSDSGLALHW
ncbi:hypothetical protein E2C01_036187 [Portunus trituberculatus]|uniref:Uncharacterized protein n=1 Tax=Portunus trituberculatus TaxID=210409 RepID=A0A5B7FDJ3_PORTR|nr:hypothetical protein [Portunus trituberculatus]